MKARDIMTSHPESVTLDEPISEPVRPEDTVESVIELMSEHQVRRMHVLEAISEPATERTRAPASR